MSTQQDGKPVVYASQGQVAVWCGVSTQAVSNWAVRFPDDFIPPDSVILGPNGAEVLGWLPSRKAEWRKFARERDSAHKRAPRRAWAAGMEL